MQQGPNSTFYTLIKNALKKNDIPVAIEYIQYCSPENAQEIFKLIFKDLFKKKFYFIKEIKTLNPTVWLAFLNRNELCSEIGAKNLRKIIKKIIPILKKLQSELEYEPNIKNLLSSYTEILRLIATNKYFLGALVERNFLSVENKEFIIAQLQTIPHIDDKVIFFYENDETNEEDDEDIFLPTQVIQEDEIDSSQVRKSKGPTFEELQDPSARRKYPFIEYLKLCFFDENIKQFILSNQDDFLLSLDPLSLDNYIFKTATFSPQEKLVILKTFIAVLESKDGKRRERAKNTHRYLLLNNNQIRVLFSRDLLFTLNTQAVLLLSVCSVTALAPRAQTTQEMLEVMNACFVPLGRAMRECIAKNKVQDITHFFDDQQHLHSLCTLYSFCTEQDCHQKWDSFWKLNNAFGNYQDILNTCLQQYPGFLHRKALSHLSFSKNDEVNQTLAKGYLKEAIRYQYLPAHLALAAIYVKKNKLELMMKNFNVFMATLKENQELPNQRSTTYRFLFEIYDTCVRQNPYHVDEICDALNRVYPGLIEKFEQTMSQAFMVKKPRVTGNDLRDPIDMLRRRLELLRLNEFKVATVEEAPNVLKPVLLFGEQPVTPLMASNDGSSTSIPKPASHLPSKK